jgi:hypothetical protein
MLTHRETDRVAELNYQTGGKLLKSQSYCGKPQDHYEMPRSNSVDRTRESDLVRRKVKK